MRRARWGVAVAAVTVLGAALPSTPAAAEPGPLRAADHVVAVDVPGGSGLDFFIWCWAENWEEGRYFEDALAARGALFAGTGMSVYSHHPGDPHTSRGRALQAEGLQVVEERHQDPRRLGLIGFAIGVFSIGGAINQPESVHFAVATWGAKPLCTATYGDVDFELLDQPRAVGFSAGPEAFGGVLAQDRRDQVVAGGRLVAPLPGGPAFALLQIGHAGAGAIVFTGDAPDFDVSRCGDPYTKPDGCTMSAGSLAADTIVSTTPASVSLGGADHGLMVIGLHPADPR